MCCAVPPAGLPLINTITMMRDERVAKACVKLFAGPRLYAARRQSESCDTRSSPARLRAMPNLYYDMQHGIGHQRPHAMCCQRPHMPRVLPFLLRLGVACSWPSCTPGMLLACSQLCGQHGMPAALHCLSSIHPSILTDAACGIDAVSITPGACLARASWMDASRERMERLPVRPCMHH